MMKSATIPFRAVGKVLAFLVCFVSGSGSLPLFAQQPDSVAGVLEEVTVTATRRITNIQSTSIAVSAFSGVELLDAGVTDLRSLVQFVPNVYMAESGGAASTPITIRGVGDNQLGLGGDGSVAIYIDGVYQGRPYANVFDLVNIERLEVLRGPQGTLYGRNATGGAINVITRSPGDEIEFYGDISYGNYDSKRIRAGLLGPLVADKVSGGLSISWFDRNGYATNLFDGKDYNAEESMNFQAELLFTPTENFEISWRADSGYNDASLVFYSFIEILNPDTFPWDPASHRGITDRNDIDADHTDINGLPPFEDREWAGTSLTFDYNAPGFTLKSITAYRENSFTESTDADATRFNFAVFDLEEDQQQFSQDFVLTSNGDGAFQWVAGFNYYQEETDGFQHTDIPIFGPPVFIEAIARNETEAYAAYFEGTYTFTENLSLTAGIRYSDEKKTYSFEQISIGLDNIAQVKGEVSFDSWNPRLVLNYGVSDSAFLYASYSDGFKSGGFSAINPVALATSSPAGHPDRFDAEGVTAYELGAKTEWLEQRLRVNMAAFLYDYENLHVNATDAIGFAKVVNAPKADIKGLELESIFAVSPALLLRFNAAYLDANYDSIISYSDGLGGIKTVDLRGNKLPRAPEFSFYFGLEYKQDMSAGSLNYRADWNYLGEAFLTELNNDVDRQQSAHRVNARIFYTTASGKYDIGVFVNNITDEQLRAHSKAILGTIYRGMLTPPRTYGIEFRFRL